MTFIETAENDFFDKKSGLRFNEAWKTLTFGISIDIGIDIGISIGNTLMDNERSYNNK